MNSPITANPEFETLLDYLKRNRGLDLTGYKRSSLMRRFKHRMQSLNIDNYQSYFEYLQKHSDEYLALLNDVLINVTSFFRDREAWDYLADQIIPKLIAGKQPDEPIRVWSAGCAAGQEICSLLIVLAEALGIEACLTRVQGFATDVDEAALKEARQAIYSDRDIAGIPDDLREKYFKKTAQGYSFHSALRRTIIFGSHDLAKDAPMSKIDLLLCRNVFIYFNLEVQKSILIRFHFALRSTGFLCLGRSETLTARRPIFVPINLKQRIYAKGENLALDDHLSINPRSRNQPLPDLSTFQNHFWKTAFETCPVAQLAVNLSGRLVGANEQANLLFGLTVDDLNRPFQDLPPSKLVSFYTVMRMFRGGHRSVIIKSREWTTADSTKSFDMTIAPVFNTQLQLIGVTVSFLDTTDHSFAYLH
jgi:two-component system, chemotaxis family, CheB/CheR fusion protein